MGMRFNHHASFLRKICLFVEQKQVFIKLFDLFSGKKLGSVRHCNEYISDVRIHGNTLMAITWYGEIQEWKVEEDLNLKFIQGDSEPLSSNLFCWRKV